jgi:hypothetical protein
MRTCMVCAVPLILAGTLGLAQAQSDVSANSPSPAASQAQDSAGATASAPTGKPERPAEVQPRNSQQDTSEKRKWRLHLGGVAVGAGYSHFSGPIYPYSYPFPYYAPYGFYPGDWVTASLWYPLWSPLPFYGPGYFAYNNGRGEVRLTAEPKDARVYIDGGYAGTADKLKNLWLDPGAYDLMVSAPGREDFHERLYVLSGKSLKITAKLSTAAVKEKP